MIYKQVDNWSLAICLLKVHVKQIEQLTIHLTYILEVHLII